MSLFLKVKPFITRNFFSPPKYVIRNKYLNIAGLQILRVIHMVLKFRVKKYIFNIRKQNSFQLKLNEDISKNGYCIIENFFKKDDFDLIKETIECIKQEDVFKRSNLGNVDVLSGPLNLTNKYINNIKKINELFDCSKAKPIIEKIICTKIDRFPNPTYQELFLKNNLIDEDDINSEFHADKFYPNAASFFYLNNNTSENGAFEYYPESHKLNLERIYFEYFYSIFASYNSSKEDLINKDFIKINGRITLNKNKFNKLFGEPIVCSAPENSMVITNNMGFHRRGKMQTNQTRRHLRNKYYDFQLNPLLRKFKKFFKNKYLNREY